MAYFQLLTEMAPYKTKLGGTRPFLSGTSGAEAVFIEVGKKVTLEVGGVIGALPPISQSPLAMSAAPADMSPPPGTPGSDVVTVSSVGRLVTLTATRAGVCALSLGGPTALKVYAGTFKNHPDMEHDLIADVFRSADPEKMHTLNRMLFNNVDNLFNENSAANIKRWKPLACGTVSKVGGAAVFHAKLDYDYKPYYKAPITGKKRSDVFISSTLLDSGCTAIRDRLANHIPSIIGLIYHDGAIQNRGINVTGRGGHTVLVVGCNKDAEKFLYIDVWKNGSRLKYEGGYAGNTLFPGKCDSLGMFEFRTDSTRMIDILRSTTPGTDPVFNGAQFLEVVAGPLT